MVIKSYSYQELILLISKNKLKTDSDFVVVFGWNQMSGDPGISAFPEEDNIFNWKGTIHGSNETVFEGTEYKLALSFPADYPFKPPKVKFETGCFHPNVDVFGNICLDILQVHFINSCS